MPYRIIEISPKSVRYKLRKNISTSPLRPSPVINGNWDQQVKKFCEDVVYKSFDRHFNDGVSWEQTEYYQFVLDRIDTKGSYKGLTKKSEIRTRCQNLDKLYYKIDKYGYRRQRELGENKINILDTEPFLPPDRKEITIHISRDGEFLWAGGAHRLSIAKLLNIDYVPVRIKTRHHKWQRLRDRIYMGKEIPSKLEGHPDLQF